jgi:TetR/AcrR family transcriptional regulator, transcriptional repressor for nem operon
MKVTREQAKLNRERVVETAARQFRERGFEGVGVADLMKSAGLTHGGFYAQFDSKEHLMVEACERAFEESEHRWRELLERAPKKRLSAIASSYLSAKHRDNPGAGCAIAALSMDAARQGPTVRAVFTEAAERFLGLLGQVVPGRSAKTRRREALASFAAMVGAVVLARTVSAASLSQEILEAVRAQLTELDESHPT